MSDTEASTDGTPTQPGSSFEFVCDAKLRNTEISTMDALVVKVADRRNISKLLTKLPAMTEDVLHCKRVRTDCVLVDKWSSSLEDTVRCVFHQQV